MSAKTTLKGGKAARKGRQEQQTLSSSNLKGGLYFLKLFPEFHCRQSLEK